MCHPVFSPLVHQQTPSNSSLPVFLFTYHRMKRRYIWALPKVSFSKGTTEKIKRLQWQFLCCRRPMFHLIKTIFFNYQKRKWKAWKECLMWTVTTSTGYLHSPIIPLVWQWQVSLDNDVTSFLQGGLSFSSVSNYHASWLFWQTWQEVNLRSKPWPRN